MPVLALWSPVDALLGIVAPLGAASAAGTALVIDLDPSGPGFGGPFSLAELVERGPTRSQLEPSKSGPAVLRNGGIKPEDAQEVIAELIARWPNVVLRCPPSANLDSEAVAVLPLLPPPFTPIVHGATVYQRTRMESRAPGGRLALPVPRAGTIRSLLHGERPPRRDRWIGALRQVWRA
ncbi:MAG: hypothetical protein ABFR95_00575 [Actinomycetota bacterium]